MAYTKTAWKDHVVDGTTVIQQGTPVSAGNLNKMEDGIAAAHAELEQASRQVQTLKTGVQILEGKVGAPVNIQIEGRTLVPMQNTVLDPLKYYVLADKKAKLKWADSTTTAGVGKFTAKAERPTLIRTANFEGKVSGSTLENPHISKNNNNSVLLLPSAFTGEVSTAPYQSMAGTGEGVHSNGGLGSSKNMTQQLFSFNVIEELERYVGKIPRATLADKVEWAKTNIQSMTWNYYGFGNSPEGNKVTVLDFLTHNNTWSAAPSFHTENKHTKITKAVGDVNRSITVDGFSHLVAYGEPTDGVTPSTVTTDYVELQIELKPTAILHDPRVPLYEVPKADYDKILVDWSADEVATRYPAVEGVKHLQNPYIMAEGENLVPPFSEWTLNQEAKIISAYELEINGTAPWKNCTVEIPVLPNTIYNLSFEQKGYASYSLLDSNNNAVFTQGYLLPTTDITTTNATVKIRLNVSNDAVGTFTYKNPTLTLGKGKKPFVPRNPSYLFAETVLGEVNGVKDQLVEQDGKYVVRKAVGHIELDGNSYWGRQGTGSGNKTFTTSAAPLTGISSGTNVNDSTIRKDYIATKYDGRVLTNVATLQGLWYGTGNADDTNIDENQIIICVSNLDSGFADAYTPVTDEIKAYFNGWKVKTANATTGKPEAWASVVDGTDAPTQTLAYVAANKAPNYTPYKISYALATPQIVPVNVEGSISVQGLTQVEVGAGVIVREKFTPVYSSSDKSYFFNIVNYGAINNPLKNKVAAILDIFKDGKRDTPNWNITWSQYAYGARRGLLQAADFDPQADYTVTYIMYNKQPFTTNPVNVRAEYANNVRTALEAVVKRAEDTATQVSVQSILMYDILKRLKAGGL